jgi:hypothetical protein
MFKCSLLPVAVATVCALNPALLHGQAPRTDCNTSGNPLDCISAPIPPHTNARLAAALEAILQQRLADRTAARQVWSQARGDNARLAAQNARSNYNAMTALVERLLADTSASAHAGLNGDLDLDFSLLADVEARYEDDTPGSGRRREALTRMSFSPAEPGGEGIFRLDEDGEILVQDRKAWTYRARMQYEPSSFLFYQTEETIPLLPQAPPAYEAAALVNGTAFSAPMPSKRRFDTKVPPGAVYPTMLGLYISAMRGELPASFTIWIVNEQGEAVPAEISVVRELMVQEPVGPADGCAGATGVNEPRRAVELQVSAGALSHTRIVLADAPHLKVSDDLKCRIVRR